MRWRRFLRRSQYKAENVSKSTEKDIERYFFARLPRLANVRRFVLSWLLLLVALGVGVVMQVQALSPYYQTTKPAPGGIYTEGIVGRFTTANPLYATGNVDNSVSGLVFSSLMKYNNQNQLIGDLADSLEADDKVEVYKLKLKDNIYWHDGQSVTVDDVIFTYQLIQNPDAKSPLQGTWRGVKLAKLDDRTVQFTLPHPLASFKYSLTNGIVPKHKLKDIPISQLRTASFNTVEPVGSGPFKWDSIQVSGQTPDTREEQIGLSANLDYYDGVPKLDKFIIKAVHNKDALLKQFSSQQVDALVGVDKLPDNLKDNTSINQYEFSLNAQVMVFFKSSNDILKDKVVRQALTRATDRHEIQASLGYPVLATKGPLLSSHLGYAPDVVQLDYDIAEANSLLDKDGWIKGGDGVREKDGKKLQFQLVSHSNSEYAYISQILQRQWRAVGVDVTVALQEDNELQSTIALHNYDALLYGITVGSDPDVYAYWHSSQADIRASSRLNLSELKSVQADSALEGGRTRVGDDLRAKKYRPLLTAWQDEAPAIALYQPRFLYITRGKVYGLDSKALNVVTDRYANVQNWRIRTERVTIQ